jgi:PmbA protein
MGSAPFDDDGVATQARRIVDQGRLEAWFLSCYSARKLGLKTTGNAGGEHNLALVSAATRAEDDLPEMLRKLGTGLFVTELMGQGVNTVTGDYSRGATGFWVEGGVIAYPVEEITIAGNLRDMFRAIVAVGADVYDRGSRRSGSVLIERMALAGS